MSKPQDLEKLSEKQKEEEEEEEDSEEDDSDEEEETSQENEKTPTLDKVMNQINIEEDIAFFLDEFKE